MNSILSIYSVPHKFLNTITPSSEPPISSDLRLWLDATDPCGNQTVILSDTSFSGWVDKSQYSNNTTALTAADSPTTVLYLVSGFNSKPTFNFVSNENRRLVGTLPVSNSSNISGPSMRVFVVGSLSDQSPFAAHV